MYLFFVKKWLFASLLCLPFLMVSCQNEPANKMQDTRFFDLAVFIKEQITLLDSLDADVTKKVRIGDTYETKTIGNVDWAKELDLFIQADISKPALQASYNIENASNTIRIYKAKNKENPMVKYVKVEFDEPTGQILYIEALISQTNYLYHSQKKISLQCNKNAGNQHRIITYKIDGYQKLIFNDKVPYQIEAQIL
jgi:hypothetical protein